MRIKIGNNIREVSKVCVRETDIMIGTQFFQTGAHTESIAKQLFEKGYADLSNCEEI